MKDIEYYQVKIFLTQRRKSAKIFEDTTDNGKLWVMSYEQSHSALTTTTPLQYRFRMNFLRTMRGFVYIVQLKKELSLRIHALQIDAENTQLRIW